jgi:predicted nuclease with TOPRIM domain
MLQEHLVEVKADVRNLRVALAEAEAVLQEQRADLERRGARVRDAMTSKSELVEELAILEQEQKKAANNIKDTKKQLAELDEQRQLLEKVRAHMHLTPCWLENCAGLALKKVLYDLHLCYGLAARQLGCRPC